MPISKIKTLLFISPFTLWLTCQASELPVKLAEFQAPRPFGIVIGDTLHHRLIIESEGYALQTDTLPSVGRMNRWLELREVLVNESQAGRRTLYRIDLTYQTFYSPLEVSMLTVPGFKLSFKKYLRTVDVRVPQWQFNMSPIRELAVLKEHGQDYMRPDDPPDPLDVGRYRLSLSIGVIALLLLLSGFAYFYGFYPFLQRGQIFNRALKALKPLSNEAIDGESYQQALRITHDAFNGIFGEPLFRDDLDRFIKRRPEYSPARKSIKAFFMASDRVFFSEITEQDKYPFENMPVLCRQCRDIERNIR